MHRALAQLLNNKLTQVGLINFVALLLQVLAQADFVRRHALALDDQFTLADQFVHDIQTIIDGFGNIGFAVVVFD